MSSSLSPSVEDRLLPPPPAWFGNEVLRDVDVDVDVDVYTDIDTETDIDIDTDIVVEDDDEDVDVDCDDVTVDNNNHVAAAFDTRDLDDDDERVHQLQHQLQHHQHHQQQQQHDSDDRILPHTTWCTNNGAADVSTEATVAQTRARRRKQKEYRRERRDCNNQNNHEKDADNLIAHTTTKTTSRMMTTMGQDTESESNRTTRSSTRLQHAANSQNVAVLVPRLKHATTTITTTKTTTTAPSNNNNSILAEAVMDMGAPLKAPSWTELSSQVLPTAAKELLSSSMRRIMYTARLSYAKGRYWHNSYSEIGNPYNGYYRTNNNNNNNNNQSNSNNHAEDDDNNNNNNNDMSLLPPFSTLPWIDRQLVKEWRTIEFGTGQDNHDHQDIHDHQDTDTNRCVDDDDDNDGPDYNHNMTMSAATNNTTTDTIHNLTDTDEAFFETARTLVPKPFPRPVWRKADWCWSCRQPFGPTLLRHHCRLCGYSFCHAHSHQSHALPHLGYNPHVPERVCHNCCHLLKEQNLAERVAWRMARCRDYFDGQLTPYFDTGIDTVEDVALRITKAAIAMARSIPLGAQAHVAVETVEVLRKYGLKGIYGLVLRKEFLAAADLLCRACDINQATFPLSVHELSAAIFYALAQHRAIRGMNPEREHLIHTIMTAPNTDILVLQQEQRQDHDNDDNDNNIESRNGKKMYQPQFGQDHDMIEESSSSTWTEPYRKQFSSHSSTSTTAAAAAAVLSESLVDETDQYDPRSAQCVTDLIALADAAIIQEEKRSSNSTATSSISTTRGNSRLGHATTDAPKPASSTAKSRKNQNAAAPAAKIPSESTADLPFRPVCDPVPDDVLSSCLFYAPIALNFVYVEREVDMQLLAAQQGWRLLYSHLEQEPDVDRPGTALFLHEEKKIACFAIRGTATIHDVVTDIRQMPVPFPENEMETASTTPAAAMDADDWTPIFRGQGLAVIGMSKAAVNLFREHIDVLSHLASKSYKIRIVGHSLGAGVATLLGTLVKRHLEHGSNNKEKTTTRTSAGGNDTSTQKTAATTGIPSDLVRVYGFATPSCVDAKLSDYLKSFVTTVVLHDDVVPRLTPTSIRGLIKHLLYIRETWVQIHLKDDLMALTERARTAWAPRWKSGFTLRDASGFCRKQLRYGKKKLLSAKGNIARQIILPSKAETMATTRTTTRPTTFTTKVAAVATTDVEQESDHSRRLSKDMQDTEQLLDMEEDNLPDTTGPKLVVEFMGALDRHQNGTVIDGDEFFDPEDSLVEQDDENDNSDLEQHVIGKHHDEDPCESLQEEDSWAAFEEQAPVVVVAHDDGEDGGNATTASPANGSLLSESELEEIDDQSTAVMLDETPLPRMFLPGKILHIYTHRGGYKAAFVPRTFRELRRISMAGNMLIDHTCKSYFEALTEVHTVRLAQEGLPQWTAFDEDDTCSCCASRFTWASTSDSEAQEARDKHNCRSCGTLCCDPCAKNRIPLPSVGLTVPVRVCDRCYNDIAGVGITRLGRTNSFSEEETQQQEVQQASVSLSSNVQDENKTKAESTVHQQERRRERRSLVVDDLASRIHSTVVVNN